MSDDGGLSFSSKQLSNNTTRIVLALLIGVVSGLGAVAFRHMIAFFKEVFFTHGEVVFSPLMGNFFVVIIPAIGGLIVGPLTYFFAREARGPGVSEVMAAVAVRGGKIRARVAAVKILASAICIGSGGSVGREGPIVQIGASFGSTMGQLLNVSTVKLRSMVACGVAGGIAATFNAPIGGVLFALEVIMGEFTGKHLMMVILSSVTAAIVARIFIGDVPAFDVPAYPLSDPRELLFYAVLGILCAIFSVIYIKVLYKSEDIFETIKMPEYLKPALGGLMLGFIGLFWPEVFGVGYESIEKVLSGEMLLATTAVLVFMKLIATSLTLGSGGSGGVFAPGLFMGAMLGATFGFLVHQLFPEIALNPAAYALVGMGGVSAGSAQAPITAIIMLFEMSGDYAIILPLMVTCILSSVLARNIYRESIYTLKLKRRGLDVETARRPDVLKNVLVRDVMSKRIETLPGEFTAIDAWRSIADSPHHGFPVVSRDNKLWGIVTHDELGEALKQGFKKEKLKDLVNIQTIIITPEEPLSLAAKKMDEADIGRLPVVDPEDENRLIGLLTRSDVITAYGKGCHIAEEDYDEGGYQEISEPVDEPAADKKSRKF